MKAFGTSFIHYHANSWYLGGRPMHATSALDFDELEEGRNVNL